MDSRSRALRPSHSPGSKWGQQLWELKSQRLAGVPNPASHLLTAAQAVLS